MKINILSLKIPALVSILLIVFGSCSKETVECLQISCPTQFTDTTNGKTYTAVTICNQCWMSQNLDFVVSEKSWCYENNNDACTTFGRLYSWDAIMNGTGSSSSNPSGVKGICPDGWHIPSKTEFQEMVDYLGGQDVAGGPMKKVSILWQENIDGDNSSGFGALPAGYFDIRNSTWKGLSQNTAYWTSTESGTENTVHVLWLNGNSRKALPDIEEKDMRFSLRCLKNL